MAVEVVSPFCSSSPPESFLPPLSPEQPAKDNDDNGDDDNNNDDNYIDDNDDLPPLFSALPAKVLKPSTLESILPSRTFPQRISTSFQDVAQTRKP